MARVLYISPRVAPRMPPESKQKLTLTVDGETVEAAKKLGLNISEVTERVLKGYTLDPERLEHGATQAQFEELLKSMDPLIQKFHCEVVVGTSWDDTIQDTLPVAYGVDGLLVEDPSQSDDENTYNVSIKAGAVSFLAPSKILKNFFTVIEAQKTRRREEVESFVLAKKFIEALTEQETRRSRADQITHSARGKKK